jgi:exodeoxyribonuclease III
MELRLLSYNIQEGGGGRLDRIARVIADRQPDAVAIQEAHRWENVETLARKLGMELVFGEANGDSHVAWLSRRPVRRAVNHRPAGLAKTLLEIELDWGGAPLRLFATHLASRHDPRPPAAEMETVLRLLRPVAGQPHLLVGDFNAIAPGDPVGTPPEGVVPRGDALPGAPRETIGALLAAGYVDCFRTRHPDEPGYTYPAEHPWLRLDYLFASPSLARHRIDAHVISSAPAARSSDHLPVEAIIRPGWVTES